MMKRYAEEKNIHIARRLTAILLAVVFVFGMMYIPAEIYAVEPDASGADSQAAETVDATEAAGTEGEQAAGEDVAAPETDASTEELQETEAEEPAPEAKDAATVEVIEELNDALTVDLDRLDEKEYDGFIYKLEDDVTKKEVKEMKSAIVDLDESEGQEVEEIVKKELYAADSIETIAEVAEPEMIEYIEPDYIVRALGTNDPYYNSGGWYLEMINAPYIWDKGLFGDGVKIAVLDSGVYKSHEDLSSINFENAFNATEEGATSNLRDLVGHGTLVTGIVAAAYNNEKGLTGIVPNATVIPVKVLATTLGEESYVIKGINHAVNSGADVINMSLGTAYASSSLKMACDAAAARGVILVAAAGNEAVDPYYGYPNPIEYPASYDSVISVGSVGKSGAYSYYSNYNQYVAVSAPGENIRGPFAYLDDDNVYHYGYTQNYSGTSFSCPMVASMAVMVKQLDRSVDGAGFERIIASTSLDKGAVGRDPYYGYGLMDLAKAYRYMVENDISMYDTYLSGYSYTYDGGVKTPSVTVKKANRNLPTGSLATSYAPGRAAVGTYNVTVTGINGYKGSKTLSFSISPPLVKGIKAPKRGKKKLTVRWKAMSKKQKKKTYKNVITGYQVRVSTSSNFANAKYASVKGVAKTSKTVKGLKKKTTYYVQYRSYKTVGGTTYYSNWSGVKKAKTK